MGKTSLVRHFCDGYFKENYLSTIGVSFLRKELEIDSNKVTLQLWDVGGQSIFGGQLRDNYLRGSHGALILFDLTEKTTLAHVRQWYEDLFAVCNDIPVIIIGNKSDLPYKDSMISRAEKLCTSLNVTFVRTSAKTGDQMNEVFVNITKSIMKRANLSLSSSESPIGGS